MKIDPKKLNEAIEKDKKINERLLKDNKKSYSLVDIYRKHLKKYHYKK